MNPAFWKVCSILCLLGAIALGGWGLQPRASCAYHTGEALTRSFNVNDTSALAQRVIRVQEQIGSVPDGQLGRFTAGWSGCGDDYPLGDAFPHLVGFIGLFLAGVFCRNQSYHVPAPERTPEPVERKPRSRPALDVEKAEKAKPVEITLDEGFDLELDSGFEEADAERYRDDDEASLMAFVEDHRQVELERQQFEDEEDEPTTDIQGFYCPAHYVDKPAIYVDRESEAATDVITPGVDPLNNPSRPFKTLQAALEMAAKRVVKDLAGVQIRLAPGVYQTSVEIPDRVAIVNHRLPSEGKPTQRLQWLTEQEVNSPDRVTILPGPDDAFAVRFSTGQNQGIYGCHIVGRESVAQVGILAQKSVRLTIFNCVVEGFSRGGIRLEESGAEVPGQGVHVVGCRLLGNTASRGGGLYARSASLTVRDCMIQENRARCGGGIWADEMRTPLQIRRTRFSNNTATHKDIPERHPRHLELDALQRAGGCGGALWVRQSKLKVVASEFVKNKASLAGGGVALFGTLASFSSDDEHAVRCSRNQARIGGGVFVSGWQRARSIFKATDASFDTNRSVYAGGALCVQGLGVAQLSACDLRSNKASHKHATGGAVALVNGAELLTKETEFRENSAGDSGGAIAAINATVRLGEKSVLRDNRSGSYGGGLFVITEPSTQVEALVSYHKFKLPFVLQIRDTTVSKNRAEDLGAGLRAGNFEPRSTFPLGLKIHRSSRIAHNRTRHPDEAGDDLWVSWANEVRATGKNRPGEKLLLK